MCLPLLIIERLPLKLLLVILFFLSIMKSFTKRFHRGAVQSQRKLLRSRELESNLICDNDTLRGVRMPPCLAPRTLSRALRRMQLAPRASCCAPRLAPWLRSIFLSTVGNLELHAGVELRVNEPPSEGSK
jgi:hypothetical protein